MIQALLLVTTKNEELDEVINSWSFTDRIVIYLNNTDEETRTYLKTKNVIVHEGEFKNFSYTRNKLLKLSKDENYKYSIMLDDTYIFKGDFTLFRKELEQLEDRVVNIKIYTETPKTSYIQISKRIIKTNTDVKYIKDIHEYINEHSYYTIQNGYIYEYRTAIQEQRTLLRNLRDVEMLKNKDDPRSLMYMAQTLFRIYYYKDYLPGIKINKDIVVSSFYLRAIQQDDDNEEKFTALMFIGHLTKEIKWYIEASIKWPDRSTESFYYASRIDDKFKKLYELHKSKGLPKHSRMPYDIFIYN